MASSYDGDIRLSVSLEAKDVKSAASALQKEIENIFKANSGKELDSRFKSLQSQMSKVVSQAQKLEQKLSDLGNQKIPTTEYTEVKKQIEDSQHALDKLLERMDKFIELGGDTSSKAFKGMQYEAAQLENTIEYAKGELQDLVETGKAFKLGSETEDYQKTVEDLGNVNNQMRILIERNNEMQSSQEGVKGSMSGTSALLKSIGNEAKKAAGHIKQLIRHLLQLAGTRIKSGLNNIKDSLLGITKHADSGNISFKKLLNTILRYGLGIRGTFFLFRKLRQAIADGFSNLSQFNGGANGAAQALKSLQESLTYLKNSWAAAFAPIVEYVVPMINALINALATLASYIGAFFSAFTGKKTMIKATKQTQGFGDAAGGAAEKQKELNAELYSFDELNKQQKKDDAGGGGGGGGAGGAGFEEVPIDSILPEAVLDWIKELKDAWKKGKFYQVGDILAKGLEAALKKLDGWINTKFRPWGVKWAGNIAKIVNGFFEHWTLWKQLGKTVSDGIAAVLDIASTFLEKVHWDSIGKAFGIFLREVFANDDMWNQISRFVSAKINALIKFINGFLTETLPDAYNWGKRIGQTIIDALKGIDWQMAADNIVMGVKWISKFIEGFISDKSQWQGVLKSIQDAFSYVVKNVDLGRLGRDINEVITMFLDFLAGLDWYHVGYQIGQFLGNIDWPKIMWDVVKIIAKALWGAIVGFFSSDHGWSTLLIFLGVSLLKGAILGILAEIKLFLAAQLLLNNPIFGGMIQTFMGGLGPYGAAGAAASGTTIIGAIKTLGGKLKFAIQLLIRDLKNDLIAIGNAFKTAAPVIGKAALGIVDAVLIAYDVTKLKKAHDDWNSVDKAHKEATQRYIDSLTKVYEKGGQEALNAVTGSNISLQEAIAQAEADYESLPHNMWQGFKAGWDSYFGAGGGGIFALVKDAFGENGLIGWVKGILGIHSPSTVFEAIGRDLVQGLYNGIVSAWKAVTAFFTSALSALQTMFTTVWTAIKTTTTTIWTGIKTTAVSLFNNMKNTVVGVANTLRTSVASAWTRLKTSLTTTTSNIRTTISTAWTSIKTTTTSMWTSISSTVSSKWIALKGTLRSVSWSDIGTNLVYGIRNGVGGAWQTLVNSVTSLANGLISRVRSLFQIHSPSKVFADIGANLSLGMAKGIIAEAGSVYEAFEDIAANAEDFASDAGVELGLNTDQMVDGLTQVLAKLSAIADTFTEITNALSNTNIPGIVKGSVVPYQSVTAPEQNNTDLAQTIAQAIANVLQSNQSNNNSGRQTIRIDISGREVFNAVVEENNSRVLRTGTSPLLGI